MMTPNYPRRHTINNTNIPDVINGLTPGQIARLKPRGPPPISPYGRMSTSSVESTSSITSKVGPIPRGPPPRGPPPQGGPPPRLGTPNIHSRMEVPTPNGSRKTSAMSPHSIHNQQQGTIFYICLPS